MDKKYILKALRPLKIKIYLHKAIKILLSALLVSGFISLILVIVSRFAVIPFVRHKMFMITVTGFFMALFVSLYFIPSRKQLIMTADSLGLKERVITAWYLIDDDSEIAALQRQDTKRVLENTKLTAAYKMSIEKSLYILAICFITTAFLLTFIPGRVFNETRIRESLIQQMKEHEKLIEEEINSQKQKSPDISDEQLSQLKEALEKLKEEFKKSESEEDALKALAQMENLIEKLKVQDPLNDLKTLESILSDSPLTKDLAEALKNDHEEALQEALEQLAEELENEEKAKEFTEMLNQAAMNMSDNSMLADALLNLASTAGSESISRNELAQRLMEIVQQTEENASGQQDFKKALADVSEALEKARRSITAVVQRIASNNAGKKTGQSEGNNGSNQGKGGQQPGSGRKSQKGAGSENRSESQGGSQSGNESGSNQQSAGAGAGAGEGTTSIDMGYNEGDLPGRGRAPGERKEEEYKKIYVPERLGGEGDETNLPGRKLDSGSSTYSEADGAPVKKGAMVPYREVLSKYREEAVQTMERQDIPIGMKELVKSYFSTLD